MSEAPNDATRWTERPHPLTETLDQLAIPDQIDRLARCDGEIFGGGDFPGLFDPMLADKLERVRDRAQRVLSRPEGQVLVAGAGTSGRLAVEVAARLKRCFPGRVTPLLAGGMGSMFQAREGAEDEPDAGGASVRQAAGRGPAMVIGISCGLSAAQVGGALAAAVERAWPAALIGFNPAAAARTRLLQPLGIPASGLDALLTASGGALLNPILGPEPLTGSSRMKGGSATAVLLDLLLHPATGALAPRLEALAASQAALWREARERLPALIEQAADSLRRGGRILYLADAPSAPWAWLDAAECGPTFGARAGLVTALGPEQALLAMELDPLAFPVTHAALGATRAEPDSRDLVLSVGEPPTEMTRRANAHLAADARDLAGALALKTRLNTLSTLAFVADGRTRGNRMIDLRISNLKLWERAAGLVSELAPCSPAEAEARLACAIDAEAAAPVTDEHRAALAHLAARQEHVIPRAIANERR